MMKLMKRYPDLRGTNEDKNMKFIKPTKKDKSKVKGAADEDSSFEDFEDLDEEHEDDLVLLATKMLENSAARDKSCANPSGQPQNPS